MANYDRAAKLARDKKWTHLESMARLNRGSVFWLLNDQRAESDLLAAIELVPDRRQRVDYAGFLVKVQRYDDAIDVLTKLTGEPTGKQLVLEAESRHQRNKGEDRAKAQSLLVQLASSGREEGLDDAHILLAQWAVAAQDFSTIETVLSTSRLGTAHPLLFHTLRAWITVARSDKDGATAHLDSACRYVDESSDPDFVFLLAQVLGLAGTDDRALPLFERCHRKGVFNAQCRMLLDCARHLDRHDVVVRVCRELREAGEVDKRLIETEIGLLQRYDLPEALRVAEQYYAAHTDDKHAALWQAWLALRMDRDDLVIRDLARLPVPEETTPQGTGIVLAILNETGQPVAGLKYAYHALREHFGEELAHGQYLAYFLQWSDHHPQMKAVVKAGPGAAVCYCEEHDDTLRWVVIEDEGQPDAALGEVGPEHHLARSFKSHGVGDVVTIAEGGIQSRRATIKELAHKYVRRFQDCMSQFQIRFPESSACQLVHVGSSDDFDPSPIFKSLEEQHKRIDRLNVHYRTNPVPVAAIARLAGRNEFETWSHLTNNSTLGIRCASGQRQDTAAALERMRSSKTIVLDTTALITLASVELLAALQDPSRTYVVSQATYDRLQDEIDEKERDHSGGGRMMLTPEGRIAIVETTPEDRDKYLGFLRSMCDAIRSKCKVCACPQAAAIDPKRREDMVKVVGLHNLESMLLGSASDHALWTDDLVIATIARTDFGTPHVWTQVALHTLVQERTVEENQYHRATAKMVGRHYHSIECNAWTIVAAAEVAEWDMAQWPVPEVMKTLEQVAANPLIRLEAAAAAIRSVWCRTLSPFTRQAFLFAVLSGLGNLRMINRLRQAIPGYFSVDVLAAGEVVELIRIWLQTHNTKILT